MSYPFTQLYDLAPSQKHSHRFYIKKPHSTICYTFGTSPSPITLSYALYLESEETNSDNPLSPTNSNYPASPSYSTKGDYFNTPQSSNKYIQSNTSQNSLTIKETAETESEIASPQPILMSPPLSSSFSRKLSGAATDKLIEILPLSTMESTGQVKGKISVDKVGYYRMFFSNESHNQRCQIDVKISVESGSIHPTENQEPEISGWLLKKKKKKMQGWAKRWCQIKMGVLSYSKQENGPSRGSVKLDQAVFSILPKLLSINIDSGNELFRFKYFTKGDFDRWIEAIRLNVDNASQQLMEYTSSSSVADRREGLALKAIERSLSIRQSAIMNGEGGNVLAEDKGPEIQAKLQSLYQTLNSIMSQVSYQNAPASTPTTPSTSQPSSPLDPSKPNQKSKFMPFRTRREVTPANGSPNAIDDLDTFRTNLKLLIQSALTDTKWVEEQIQKELDSKRKLELQYINAMGNLSHANSSRASSPFLANSKGSLNNILSDHSHNGSIHSLARPTGHRSRRSKFLSTTSIDTMEVDEEFFDAVDVDQGENGQINTQLQFRSEDSPTFPDDEDEDLENPLIIDENDDDDDDSPNENESTPSLALSPTKLSSSKPFTRRQALPAPTSGNDVNLLTILRQNIGKDLSTISMPISLNEPLSILQRMCEEFEYSEFLDRALTSTSSMDRLLMVTAFAFSAYASAGYRAERKPFNPLLGETYESLRPDHGFRFLAEKVSHTPLIFAYHCTSIEPGWEVWSEVRPKNKFWGKSMELNSLGTTHVTFKHPTNGNVKPDHFVYNRSVTWMRNLVGGRKYIEQSGEVKITNLTTGEHAKIVFRESTLFSSSNQEAKATLHDAKGNVIHKLTGQWNNSLMIEKGKDNLEILWKTKPLPSNAESMYCFTSFAMELNELTPDLDGILPPTDTRLRPDQRLFEDGKVEAAEAEKIRVEEGQRARRRQREARGEEYQPIWFKLQPQTSHENQSEDAFKYQGEYWELRNQGKFSNIPKIF